MSFARKHRSKKKEKQPTAKQLEKKEHKVKVFDDGLFVTRVIHTAWFPFVRDHVDEICRCFSDVLFLEAQVIASWDDEICAAYDKVLLECRSLVDALFLSENRSGIGIIDRKYSEHITFRSQDGFQKEVEAFWKLLDTKSVAIHEHTDLHRVTLDTFYPLAVTYLHVFGNKKWFAKRAESLYHQHDIPLIEDEGYVVQDEIFGHIDYAKKYVRKMLRRIPDPS